MNIASILKNELGLSRDELTLLTSPKSFLPARKTQTCLPAATLENLYEVYVSLTSERNTKQLDMHAKNACLRHAKTCRTNAQALRRKLRSLKEHYLQTTRLLQWLETIKQNDSISQTLGRQRVIERLEERACKKLEMVNPGKQTLLMLKITSLEAEAAFYERAGNEVN